MRVSEQLMKLYWLPVLTLALTAGTNPSMALGQIVVPATERLTDEIPANGANTAPADGTVSEWLAKARQASLDRDFQLAEQYIQIAEELYQQRPAGSQLNFTPEMARQELADIKARTTATMPGAINASPPPDKEFPVAAMNVPQVSTEDIQNAARRALLKSRQALAHGDVETATLMANSAKQYQVDFDTMGDSPNALEMMIFHQNNLSALALAKDKTYNQRAAMFLLQQAQSLIGYEDYGTATNLINQAKSFPVEFTEGPQHPDALMALIQAKPKAPQTSDVKAAVMKLMSQAQFATDQRQWEQAKSFVDQAKSFNLADSEFAAGETRPWQLELQITQALNMQTFADNKPVVAQTNFAEDDSSKVVQADYDPTTDTTHNAQVTGYDPLNSEVATPDSEDRLAKFPEFNPIPSRGMQLYRSGLQALDNADSSRAKEYFEMAWRYEDQLDPATRQAIQDHLSNMTATSAGVRTASAEDLFNEETGQIPADDVRGSQQAMFRKLQGEVFKERAAAERLLESSPREALEKMTMVRSRIAQSEIDPNSRRPLLTIIDRDIAEMQRYIDKNLPEIINDETNAARMESVDLRRQRGIDVEMQIQKLVEDFDRLVDEERYPEAEMIARQAQELSPESDVVVALTEKAKFLTRFLRMSDLKDRNERGVWNALRNSQESGIPMDSDTPMLFDAERFEERAAMRSSQLGLGKYDSEAERIIWNLLKNQKVQGEYTGTLSSAVEQLSRQAGVNIIFDKIALAAEGVETDSNVDVPIRDPISLQSALKIILGSAGLVFVVEDEVIKVTSRDAQQKDVSPQTYYVGDLVTPITNFSSTMQMNFMQPGSGNANQGFNNNQLGGGPMSMPVAQSNPAAMNGLSIAQQSAMAQQLPGGLPGGFGGFDNYGGRGPQTGTPTYSTIGPQRLGGVTEADFFPLIELIKTTVNPDSWDDSNGDGTIQAFVPNLSLIVSQTQEVQDQIQDLLKKLRELNDVQIVIEVRFITLQDNFFERVGVDFDFQINDNSNLANPIPDNVSPSSIIGNTATGPTADLDVVFDQDSFASAIPQFGGFDVGTAANFGFAILSDIEVFFLIQASKGDTRSNIMQAPTVTMFNGQSANVTDGALRPFVTSVTPVVGDFAVAQQPVITILPDGTSLNVQAVVSNDRQFVRMTLVPFFSQVQEVTTFTFDGTTTTRRSTNSLLDDLIDSVGGGDPDRDPIDEFETETSGVTIQLPVLATTSVSTVVSVPDGGTVLMGGIKRMSEGRTERGVPFLSNIPYVNRLFKNVGIGRDTSNLMMMVTPRIIIQAEEERIQVGDLGSGN